MAPVSDQRPVDPTALTFEGYRRGDGSLGVRNNVLVMPSVICSHIVADRIADATDRAVSVPHDHGCAQIGADHEQTERTMVNLSQNPNIAGTTVVGLGCEHLQSDDLAAAIAERDRPVRETAIQAAGGSDACIEEGTEATRELARTAESSARTEATLSDLTVGVVSSDVEASTREVADPLVGEVVASLLEAGGRVVVAGTERLAAHVDTVAERAANDAAAESLRAVAERSASQPGNVRNIVHRSGEHSLESLTGAWGGAPVEDVLEYGEQATADGGLSLVDAPSRFEEATTALAAAGASIVVHVTADGIPTGHPVVPVLKVTGDEATATALATDMDVDARTADADEVLRQLAAVAGGERTATERHGLTKFAISRIGPSL
ncbi:UxaA family hydrolase [Halomicroarcula sp. GCM10025817]|uniref:UxaA family hydrolase n=1 Tax=Haloarcula TaxID=2237 RepID=UPI0023E865A2|nr:UxaA family hydrolase [Halomicroarcula sp. SYNS111]